MSAPTINDLRVYRDSSGSYSEHYDYYEVWSYLTRGRCADVTVTRSNPERMTVRPFLIRSYMQGITHQLICDAVQDFRSRDAAADPGGPL